jgi:hypothetical protein
MLIIKPKTNYKKTICILYNNFKGIKTMISKFTDAHPQVLNIITTNYDRVLEYIMSYNDMPFTDGFNGKTLSIFEPKTNYKKTICILY